MVSQTNTVIVDLGTGNLRSVSNAVEFVSNTAVLISDKPDDIRSADHLILPGQGAMGTWMDRLCQNQQLNDAVMNRLNDGPVLGICLGLQALYEKSEENEGVKGLGMLGGKVRHFSSAESNQSAPSLKIPHMGWNQVSQTKDHPVWHGIVDQQRFYFVHSYFAETINADNVVGETEYGVKFTAAAASKNIFATQFHPEKSQQPGLQLIKNFLNWNGAN